LSTAAFGALSLFAAKPVAQWFIDPPVRIEQTAMQQDIIPAPPELYWQRTIGYLRSVPLIEESGPADPPTRY
jgi:hypothetical protein